MSPDDLVPLASLGRSRGEAKKRALYVGLTHACPNPLTARVRNHARGCHRGLLPHVVRWNADGAGQQYASLLHSTDALVSRLAALAVAGGLPRTLRDIGVSRDDLPVLAQEAAEQWTGRFNPRSFDAEGALEVYACAF